MRKALLLLLMCCAMSVSAQKTEGDHIPGTKKAKIDIDKQYDDGNRVIRTNSVSFAYSNKFLQEKYETVLLSKFILINGSEKSEIYSLSFYRTSNTISKMPKGSKLLIKTTSGKVITLKLSSEIDASKNHLSTLGSFYYFYPEYEISTEDLNTIMFDPVIKIRMEDISTNGYTEFYSKDYKRWIFSAVVRKCYNLIKEKEKSSNSIYDGF